jgi:hypothetical protein
LRAKKRLRKKKERDRKRKVGERGVPGKITHFHV